MAAGAALSAGCVLAAAAASSAEGVPALGVSSAGRSFADRALASLVDDTTSLLDASSSLSLNLLSLLDALAVRTVAAADSRSLLVVSLAVVSLVVVSLLASVAGLSAVSLAVASTAVLRASLLLELLVLDSRVLGVTADVASSPDLTEVSSPDLLFRPPFLLDLSFDVLVA